MTMLRRPGQEGGQPVTLRGGLQLVLDPGDQVRIGEGIVLTVLGIHQANAVLAVGNPTESRIGTSPLVPNTDA